MTTLNYGDPEPPRDTKWRSPGAPGWVIRFKGDGWGKFGSYEWERMGPSWFPMEKHDW